jgi:hypothetical protein
MAVGMQPLDSKAVPSLGHRRQYFGGLLLPTESAATGDGARSEISQDRNESFGILAPTD